MIDTKDMGISIPLAITILGSIDSIKYEYLSYYMSQRWSQGQVFIIKFERLDT